MALYQLVVNPLAITYGMFSFRKRTELSQIIFIHHDDPEVFATLVYQYYILLCYLYLTPRTNFLQLGPAS
jgi:hypothetical protein